MMNWFKKKEKVAHTVLRNEKGEELSKKPWSHESMLLSFAAEGRIQTVVLPLTSFTIEHDDLGFCTLIIHRENVYRNILPARTSNLYLSACLDPHMEWAGDWVDLGSGGVKFAMENVWMTDNLQLTFKCFEIHTPLEMPKIMSPDRVKR